MKLRLRNLTTSDTGVNVGRFLVSVFRIFLVRDKEVTLSTKPRNKTEVDPMREGVWSLVCIGIGLALTASSLAQSSPAPQPTPPPEASDVAAILAALGSFLLFFGFRQHHREQLQNLARICEAVVRFTEALHAEKSPEQKRELAAARVQELMAALRIKVPAPIVAAVLETAIAAVRMKRQPTQEATDER